MGASPSQLTATSRLWQASGCGEISSRPPAPQRSDGHTRPVKLAHPIGTPSPACCLATIHVLCQRAAGAARASGLPHTCMLCHGRVVVASYQLWAVAAGCPSADGGMCAVSLRPHSNWGVRMHACEACLVLAGHVHACCRRPKPAPNASCMCTQAPHTPTPAESRRGDSGVCVCTCTFCGLWCWVHVLVSCCMDMK